MDDVTAVAILWALIATVVTALVFAFYIKLGFWRMVRELMDMFYRRATMQPFQAQLDGEPCTWDVVGPMVLSAVVRITIVLALILIAVFILYDPYLNAWRALSPLL